jgi:DNA polymerase-3 subunit beta
LAAKVAMDCSDSTKICIDAKMLLQTLRGLIGREVTLTFDTNGNNIIQGKYNNGTFTLPFDKGDEYPTPTKFDENESSFIIDAQQLMRSIDMVRFSVASDELRPQMNGVNFDLLNNCLVTAASDGSKLAKFSDFAIKNDKDTAGFILPTKPCNILTNILQKVEGNVKVAFDSHLLSVNNESFKLSTRLIEGRFPNYNAVIPTNNNIVAIVEKNEIIGALKRVMPLGSSTTKMTVLDFNGMNLTVSSENIDFSTSASETIPCEFNGERIRIAFEGSFLEQSIQNVLTDKVKLLMSEPSRACVIKPFVEQENTEYLSLLMPMQLKN